MRHGTRPGRSIRTRDGRSGTTAHLMWAADRFVTRLRPLSLGGALVLSLARCDSADLTEPAPLEPGPTVPGQLTVAGLGAVPDRYTAEVWVVGTHAYTSTWGRRGPAQTPGNMLYIWDVTVAAPRLVDSLLVDSSASTLGDVQASDDGRLLVVPTELDPGSIVIFDLADPVRPRLLARYRSPAITRGVHTCELARVNGVLYAFLSVNRGSSHASRLIVVNLSDPAQPRSVLERDMGEPFIHDVFVRDGILFTALWDGGTNIWDLGGAGRGGSVANPILLGNVRTVAGNAHNVWWYRDGRTGQHRYAFVGEEGPASTGASSSGDVHVVDVTDLTNPREVAVFGVPGAGTHNFTVDEARGILYAAYYNGGVQALDVRGDLGSCTVAQQRSDSRCDLTLMGRLLATGLLDQNKPVFVWGVHFSGDALYASDMLNGLWKLTPISR